MKVMLLNSLFYPNIMGGAERSVQYLAEGLVDLGHQVVVVSLDTHEHTERLKHIKLYYLYHHNLFWGGMPTQERTYRKILWHLRDIFNRGIYLRLEKVIREERPDVIHTNMITGFSIAPWFLARRFKIPLVHTLREYSLMCPRNTMFRRGLNCQHQCFSCRLFTIIKKYLSNHGFVAHVVGLTNFVIHRFREEGYFVHVPSSRIFNSVPNSTKPLMKGTRSEGLPIRILYLGRIEKAKGVDRLLDAVGQVEGIELLLGGRIVDEEIQAGIEGGRYPQRIKFLGFIDPEEVFDEIDLAIIPSVWHEPFGRVVIESYQHGKPVIATSRGGLHEIIVDGQTGFLYDPDQIQGLIEILTRIVDLPAILDPMIQNIESYLHEFRSQYIARQYEMVYRNVCSGGGG